MDNQEERLSGPVAEDDGQTVIPTSPHGSSESRRSSTSQGSVRSSHSSHKSEPRQETVVCRYCNTVLACLLVGVLITLGSVSMTVIGYFAMNIASQIVTSGNSTTLVIDEQLHDNLYKFRTFGPVMIGFGGFLIMCACVLLCEEKDKKIKYRNQASEHLLSEHERIMQQARERFYNENRNALMVESQTVDYRTSKASSNDLTSCLDSEMVGNSVLTQVKPLPSAAMETDNASCGASGSPVVLVHGPTITEPIQCAGGDNNQCTNENEVTDSSPSHSNHSSPDHKFGSPSRTFKKNNSVRPLRIEDTGSSGLVLPISSVLPKIESPHSSNGISRAGGAIPKSILVQPTKLSPIRSVNGPIRVRLDDSPTDLVPISPPSTSNSAECLQQPRSPKATSGRMKRGKKKKLAGGLDAGSLGQCRCLSDPSVASMRSLDRQLDACCCLQPGCCWGGNCQLDKSIPRSLTSAAKSTDDPLVAGASSGGKANAFFLQPLNKDTDANAQSIELKPKSLEILGATDHDNQASKIDGSLPDTHLMPKNGDSRKKTEDQDTVRDDPPPQGASSSPSRQINNTNEGSSPGDGDNATTSETNPDALVMRDRNSNITRSSKRQDTTPGNSAPYSGQTQGGVMV